VYGHGQPKSQEGGEREKPLKKGRPEKTRGGWGAKLIRPENPALVLSLPIGWGGKRFGKTRIQGGGLNAKGG